MKKYFVITLLLTVLFTGCINAKPEIKGTEEPVIESNETEKPVVQTPNDRTAANDSVENNKTTSGDTEAVENVVNEEIPDDEIPVFEDGNELARYLYIWDKPSKRTAYAYLLINDEKYKFESVINADDGGHQDYYMNGNELLYDMMNINEIYIMDDIILIAATDGYGDGREENIYAFDMQGNRILNLYWLDNKGMVMADGSSLDIDYDNSTIKIKGYRITPQEPGLVMKSNISESYPHKDLIYYNEVFDYDFYIDDFGWITGLQWIPGFEQSNPVGFKLKDEEIIVAEYELKYLGGYKFAPLEQTEILETWGSIRDSWGF